MRDWHYADGDLECERCRSRTVYGGALMCTWWPAGCQGSARVCWDCATPGERRQLADSGCSTAAWRLGT